MDLEGEEACAMAAMAAEALQLEHETCHLRLKLHLEKDATASISWSSALLEGSKKRIWLKVDAGTTGGKANS